MAIVEFLRNKKKSLLLLLLLIAFTSVSVEGQQPPACDISGNWTSTLDPNDPNIVHIEIFQNSSGQISVYATPWGGAVGPGYVSGYSISLLMVGANEPSEGVLSNSPYPSYNTHTQAPNCSFISFGWCKFPYCPEAEPVWPPFPPPPPPQPCALSGAPCPVPEWAPTWQLNLSTVLQPCNSTGFFEPSQQWGLISFDWSNAIDLWMQFPTNQRPCEEFLVLQGQLIKEQYPQTKVFVYRNMELALEWLSSERHAMYDSSKSDYFLRYLVGPNVGQIYNEPISAGDQYFWNFTNPDAVQYWINEVVLGTGGISSPYVDGVFSDDVAGIPEEHPNAITNMGLSQSDVLAIQEATTSAWLQMLDALLPKQGYNWQAFGNQDGVAPNVDPSSCTTLMQSYCSSEEYSSPKLIDMGEMSNETISAFLVARGPYWWLGYGWMGCDNIPLLPDLIMNMDVGMPLNNCTEIGSGVFARNYTNGYAMLNCNSFTSVLDF